MTVCEEGLKLTPETTETPIRPSVTANVDPTMGALGRTLEEIRAARAALDAAEAGILAMSSRSSDLVPLKRAAFAMGIEEDAARKRAQRGDGVQVDGRWHFTRWYVDEVRRRKTSR